MKKFFIILFSLFCLLHLSYVAERAEADYRFLSEYMQTVFSEGGPIPITNANKVVQTRDGYIWVASYSGLIRYDGKASKVFGKADNFPTSNVTTLHEAANGDLWIGTNDAGVALYRNGTFRTFAAAEGLPSTSVRALADDKLGNVYVATAFGLVKISPDLQISRVDIAGRDYIFAVQLHVAHDGVLWCALSGGGVLAIGENGEVVADYASNSLHDLALTSVFQASDGRFFLGSYSNKFLILNDAQGSEIRLIDAGPLSTINSFYEDSTGRVWACSDNGVGFMEGADFQPVLGTQIDSSVENMIEDYEGNFWFSSSRKGVLHAVRGKFKNLSFAWRIPDLTVNSTCLHSDRLYIGADEGLFIYDADGGAIHNELSEMLKGVRIRSVISDSAGNIWICTYKDYGVVRYGADGEIVSLTTEHGLPDNKVRCSIELKDGRIAIGTGGGVAVVEGDRIVKTYAKADGLGNAIILTLCEDADGAIYAGSDGGGIYKIAKGRVENISEAEGLTSGIVLRTAYDARAGGIWISMGNAVGFLDDTGVRILSALESKGASVFDIKFVGDEEIWLLAASGIHILNRQNALSALSGGELDVVTLDKRDGLEYTVTANSWSHFGADGVLFISCNHGLVSIDTQDIYANGTVPKLRISSVVIDDTAIQNPSAVEVPASATRLTINYAFLSYASSSGNYIHAFLEGFDKSANVIPTDENMQVSYTNLAGGQYKFHLRGVSRSGVESNTILLPINKEYQLLELWYIRVLMQGGLLAALLLIGFAVYRHKTKSILRRQQAYRAITDQAITAIADTIDAKDKYTSGHSKRVAQYSLEIAKRMGMSPDERENLYYAALLHDIGKIGLEDSILNKNGKLTDEEYAKMQHHVDIGGEILKSITVIDNVATGALYHHERFDGRGYSNGLSGADIPLFARIICVADSYDAMTTDRPYRAALSEERVLEELTKGRNTQFDEEIVAHMIDIIRASKSKKK